MMLLWAIALVERGRRGYVVSKAVGGGVKKVLYTLRTVQRIGLARSAKALNSKNACKACGLGMGGQMGGMTNEAGEYPSVCNKSVQAQSTDIQPAIPVEVFEHTLDQFSELEPRELESLGRLAHPLYKAADSDRYHCIDWDEATSIAAARLGAAKPSRSFFYSSGRSSNEAGFVFQLLARAYGTNNVNNCSYYCHEATGVGLGSTIGTGTSTVELADLDRCDLIFVIGANPASNHPRFIHKLMACRERGGEVIVINPAREAGLRRFAAPKKPKSLLFGGTEIASDWLQPRIGEDLALFKGLAKVLLEEGLIDQEFIDEHTQGFDALAEDLAATSWDEIAERCGIGRPEIERVARLYAQAKSAVFAWGMGMTHHRHGVENVEFIANLALMCGMIGRPGAGLLPLRGHSNVQGIGTIGVKPVLANEVLDSLQQYFDMELPSENGWDTMSALRAAYAGDVDVAVLMGGNLLAATPNAAWAREALDSIGTRVCLTTTLNASHVHGVKNSEMLILPVAARDEEWESTTQESMFNFVRLSDGQITRHANVRPEVTVLVDIAQQLMPQSSIDFAGFKKHRTVREAIAAIVPGMSELASIDVAKKEFHVANRLMHTPNFRTASGRGQFRVCELPPVADEAQFAVSTHDRS